MDRGDWYKLTDAVLRYGLIVIAAWGNFAIFNLLFTQPTINVLIFVLRPFFDVIVVGNLIFVNGFIAEITAECVMGLAYFVLFFLIFSTAQVTYITRILALLIGFTLLFALNIARMVFLVFIIEKPYFAMIHFLLEHFFSVVIVGGIWLGLAWLFKIKTIPVYSDVKDLLKLKR